MKILVMGDSSSAGIGSGLDVYPYQLFRRLEKSRLVEVQNHSTPGFTSADAARYFRMRLSRQRWDAVIVYLGNNEGSTSAHKGRYRPLMDLLGFRRRRSSPRPFAQSGTAPELCLSEDEPKPASGPATTPTEFSQNLSEIIRLAKSCGAVVILVSPFANREYPASAGPLISSSFKIIGLPTRVGHAVVPVGETSTIIRDAILAQEQGHYQFAARSYNAALARHSPEWLMELSSNNLAVLLHDTGRSRDAEQIFASYALRGYGFSSIFTYNRARLLRDTGRNQEADEWFGMAAEQDKYLYRIKDAYRNAIANTAVTSGARLLDLSVILSDDMFVDYCHPTAIAHNEIASALSELLIHLPERQFDQCTESSYRNYYPSPNAYEYCDDDLVDYYSIAPCISEETISAELAQVTIKLKQMGVHDSLRALQNLSVASREQIAAVEALSSVARHPMITCTDDLLDWPLQESCELGRMPEHYIYRLLLCYLDWAYAHGISPQLADDDTDGEMDLRLFYQRLMIGRKGRCSETRINLSHSYRRRLRQQVLGACLEEELFRDIRAERLITVLRWYTREAFRYGTQSRIGMLYPEMRFDSILEALRVWMVIARFHRHQNDECLIRALYGWLRGLERIHRIHSSQFLIQRYSASEDDERRFRRELLQWKDVFPE